MNKARVELLKRATIFRSLPERSLERLSARLEEKRYRAGSYIFREGTAGDALMLVQSGNVEIRKYGSSGDADVHLADRGVGEIFGEMALIEESPRFADARARDEVSVLILSKGQFGELLAENPEIAVEIMGLLSAKLRQADLQMIEDLERKNAQLKAANENLSREKNFRDKIIYNAPFFMIITDQANNVFLLNGSAEKTFGFSMEDVRNRSIDRVIRIVGDGGVFGEITSSLMEKSIWRGELIVSRADGSPIIVDLTAVHVGHTGGDDGDPSVLYMGYDVTEEKHMQRQAFQLERMATRGEMAAEIAHELNNYLSIVSGNLELLGLDIERRRFERVGKKTESMKDGLARITRFVEGLMSVARPDARREIFDIRQFIENELFFLRPQPKFKGIDFVCQWGDDIPAVEADNGQLQQVLINLFNNAADALSEIPPGNRLITISTAYAPDDDRIRLTITDNGCGMTEEEYSRVFRQHFTSKKRGHGFGLLAVKRVIKSHGGKISAAPGPEGGASFTIELPRRMSVPAVEKAPVPR